MGLNSWVLHPGQVFEWTFDITVATAFGSEVYPRIREFLKHWFTEIPEQERKRVRAMVFDQENNLIDEVRLPDDL